MLDDFRGIFAREALSFPSSLQLLFCDGPRACSHYRKASTISAK
jgi:hypothetical protein